MQEVVLKKEKEIVLSTVLLKYYIVNGLIGINTRLLVPYSFVIRGSYP